MPHRIDIDGISRNLFLLQNLSLASNNYCRMFKVSRYKPEGEFGWGYYIGWLKSIVSEKLIESAIKFRVIQDTLKDEIETSIDFNQIETRALADITIGMSLADRSALSIREACNKIIHATEVRLTWISKEDDGSYESWNGDVILEGVKRDRWVIELYVTEFCIALERLLSILGQKIDWHHFYEYDE